MPEAEQPVYDASPIFDNLDVDLVLKVLSHTAFSQFKSISHIRVDVSSKSIFAGPFFTFFIPVFYVFQGLSYTNPAVVISSAYYVAVCAFCALVVFCQNESTALNHWCRVIEVVF
jgi:hypothetical protein